MVGKTTRTVSQNLGQRESVSPIAHLSSVYSGEIMDWGPVLDSCCFVEECQVEGM